MDPLTGGMLAAATGLLALGLVVFLAFWQIRRTGEIKAALTDAQARLGGILESAMDAIITVDEAQTVLLFNRAAESMFGCRKEDALGKPLDRFLPVRYRAAHHGHVEEFGRTGVTSRRMGPTKLLWALRYDGSEEFPIEASISQLTEGDQRYYTVILRDATARKHYEDELQRQQDELRELSASVLEARENEKTRIARELHDELGQMLTALKMDLSWLRERLPAELVPKAQGMNALLDDTVAAVRRISADLRPLMLDDLGLAAAADWLVTDFAKRSGLDCKLDIVGQDAMDGLKREASNTIYRALQESLTNVARHAGARHVWVILEKADGEVRLEIEDDGCGIAVDELPRSRSLGLKGMRERVTYLQGQLEIARAPRGGTRLRIRVPA
jgi:PAS domain S-box-containing protein